MVINVLFGGDGRGATSNDNDGIWRPVRLHSRHESADEDDRRISEAFRTVCSLLNKLSPANFSKIVKKFKSLLVDNPRLLDQCAALLVDKAITEPLFSRWYVEMLCSISDGPSIDEIKDSIPYRARVLFVEKLILTFNDLKNREFGDGNPESIVIETAEVQEQRIETEFRFRRKFIGAGRVIAESFILGILSLDSLNRCIESLFSSPKETSLMCLCGLMTTIGRTFEFYLDDIGINEYFLKINKILNSPLPTKSRFMLLNLLQYKENNWTSNTVSRNLLVIEQLLHVLLEFYGTKDGSDYEEISESDFLIEAKEASYINNIFNKFNQCPRNSASVLNLYSELAAEERTRLVRLFVKCVTKNDIYSDDCGNLFACLVQSKKLIIPDIILGIKTVIRGYRKQLIFADQQIWARLKEIFQPLIVADVFSLSDLENDSDIQKMKEIKEEKQKQSKKKPKSEPIVSTLSWRRGLPVVQKVKGVPKKKRNGTNLLHESEETNQKKDKDES